MSEQLSEAEKSALLGARDNQAINSERDQELFEAMLKQGMPHPSEIDDLARRAILKFILEVVPPMIRAHGHVYMLGFVHGYLVGQKRTANILRPEEGGRDGD